MPKLNDHRCNDVNLLDSSDIAAAVFNCAHMRAAQAAFLNNSAAKNH